MTRSRLLGTLAILSLVVSACGGPDSGGALEPPDGSAPPTASDVAQVRVTLSEWTVVADPVSAPAGLANFRVTNEGTQDHELVVIRTDLAADALPTADGVVDTEADDVTVRSEIEPFAPGGPRTLTLTVDAGDYVLVCNVPGHYQQGMRAAFAVT